MSANDTPETLEALLQEARADLVKLIGFENEANAQVVELEAQRAEAEAEGQHAKAATLLNQRIAKKGVARGIQQEAQKAYARVQILLNRIADAEARARDHAALFARITADQASGMDDMAGIGVAA